MAALTHLKSLQALELAIRKGSLKAAAAELAITPAALGQRIKVLEDYLGCDLLVRGRSGTRPTRELEAATAHLSAGFRELETAARILDFQRVHEIHITADGDWAELWLAPRLARFRAERPNTLFCINGVGDVPLRLGEADCDVRFEMADAGAEGDTLFADYLLPVSSPGNAARISRKPEDERLEGFPLLHLESYERNPGAIGWPEWIRRYGYRKTAPERGMRYQRILHALEAVYANAGLIVCGLALVHPLVDEGRLTLPFPVAQGVRSKAAYRARFSPAALRRVQVQQFRSWLADEAAATEAGLQSALAGGS